MRVLNLPVATLVSGAIADAAFIGFGTRTVGVKADVLTVPPNPRTASLTQVRNPNFRRHGPLALAKIYRKYGVPLPEDLRLVLAAMKSHHRRDTGSVVATPESNDLEYLLPVFIGTPPQQLNIDMDTGSSDLWVFSTEIPSSQSGGQTEYDPSKSTTARNLSGATWDIRYGDGSSSGGDVYIDRVEIGNISFANQAVEAANRVSAEFSQDSQNDGVFGLAFSILNQVTPDPQQTFFDNLIPDLDKPLFTVDLKSHNREFIPAWRLSPCLHYTSAGNLNFGYIDPKAYTGDIAYTPVNDTQGFWAFTAPGYAVGSASQEYNIHGVTDTGTTLLLLPKVVVDDYYSSVPGAAYDKNHGGVTFKCSASMPDLSISIGDNATVTIPGEYIRYGSVESSGDANQLCFGGLQSDVGIGFSIFGDVFLKATFVVFDAGELQLGFAAKNL